MFVKMHAHPLHEDIHPIEEILVEAPSVGTRDNETVLWLNFCQCLVGDAGTVSDPGELEQYAGYFARTGVLWTIETEDDVEFELSVDEAQALATKAGFGSWFTEHAASLSSAGPRVV